MAKEGRIKHSAERQAEYDPISRERICDFVPTFIPGIKLAHPVEEEFYEAGDLFFYDDKVTIIGFEGECRPAKHFNPLWHQKYSGIGIPIGKVNDRSEWDWYVISHKTDPTRLIVMSFNMVQQSPITGRYYINSETGEREWGKFYDVPYHNALYYEKDEGGWRQRTSD